MNVTALIVAVQDRTGTSTTDGLLTSAVLTRLLNDANHHIATIHDWPWQQVAGVSFSTGAGTASYAASTFAPAGDWLRTIDLRVTAPNVGEGLTFYGPQELDDTYPSPFQGSPLAYAIDGPNLRIAPTPDGVYTLSHRYVKVEPDLSAGSDTPLMPSQFHPAIVEYAAYLALRRISEEVRANVALGAFDRWLRIMGQDRRRSTAPQRVRVRPGGAL